MDNPGDRTSAKDQPRPGRRRWVRPVAVFCLVLLLALILHRCHEEPPPVPDFRRGHGPRDTAAPPPPDTVVLPAPAPPETMPVKRPRPALQRTRPPPDTAKPGPKAGPDSALPYVYADPWGGRHFDSVTVTLHCREGCLILYSLTDSVNFKTYDSPFTFRRDATLWISGVDSLNRQVPPLRIDYVIARNPGACGASAMPVDVPDGGRTVCMDVYEWPNREGEYPRAFAAWQGAADSCRSAGKRLCSLAEWQAACRGPDQAVYPYAAEYNENHCPAKEAGPARSGRFPACRSYFGVFDMTGNLWEWTSTRSQENEDFYLVAGGNWNAGGDARCGLAKFSFYPNVGYPFVGFRCCAEAAKK